MSRYEVQDNSSFQIAIVDNEEGSAVCFFPRAAMNVEKNINDILNFLNNRDKNEKL